MASLQAKLDEALEENAKLKEQNRSLLEQIDDLERTINELRVASVQQRRSQAMRRNVSEHISKGVQMFEELIEKAGAAHLLTPSPSTTRTTAATSRATARPVMPNATVSRGSTVASAPAPQQPPAPAAPPAPKAPPPQAAPAAPETKPAPAAENKENGPAAESETKTTVAAQDTPVSAILSRPEKELSRRVSSVMFQQDLARIQATVEYNDDSDEEEGEIALTQSLQSIPDAGKPKVSDAKPVETVAPAKAAQVPVAVPAATSAASAPAQTSAPASAPQSAKPVAQAAPAAAAKPVAKQSSADEDADVVLSPEQQAVLDIARDLKEAQEKLPLLVAYLDKRSPSGLHLYQKRYVAVYDYNIYYSKDPISAEDIDAENPSRSPIHCLPLIIVNSIIDIQGTAKFTVQARDPKYGALRDYSFRAPTPKEKDVWVKGLNDHRNHLLSMLRWVSLNKESVEVDWH